MLWRLTLGSSSWGSRKCQTVAASPAEPGGLLSWSRRLEVSGSCGDRSRFASSSGPLDSAGGVQGTSAARVAGNWDSASSNLFFTVGTQQKPSKDSLFVKSYPHNPCEHQDAYGLFREFTNVDNAARTFRHALRCLPQAPSVACSDPL